MPDDNNPESIGGVTVSIRGDASQLNQDFQAAQQQAAAAGEQVAAAFSRGQIAELAVLRATYQSVSTEIRQAAGRIADAEVQAAEASKAGHAALAQSLQTRVAEERTALDGLVAKQQELKASITGLVAAQKEAEAAAKEQASAETQLAAAEAAAADQAARALELQAAAAGASAYAAQQLGGAAGGAVPPLNQVAQAAGGAVPPLNNVNDATGRATLGMFQLYAALSLVRRGLNELDKFVDSEEHLKHLAEATGVTAVRLAEFEGAIQRAGGDGDKFSQVLQRLARAEESAREGSASMQDDLRRLGVTAKDPIEAFFQIADAIHNTSDRFEALGAASRVTGRNAVDLIGILSEGSGVLRANAEASHEVAVALAEGIPAADEYKRAQAELRQTITLLTAQSLPGIVDALKAVAAAFAVALLPVKLFFTTLIDSTLIAIQSGKVLADIATGQYIQAGFDATEASGRIAAASKKLSDDIKKDWTDTQAFLDKIGSGKAPAQEPGAGLPFPAPVDTSGNKAAEIEEQSQLQHDQRLLAMTRERIAAELNLEKLAAEASLAILSDKHTRAIALAATEVSLAREKLDQETQANAKGLKEELDTLNRKEALAREDGKKSTEEVARIEAEKLTIQDKFAADEQRLRETLAAKVAELGVIEVRENKARLDEELKDWTAAANKEIDEAQKKFDKEKQIERRVFDSQARETADTQQGGLNLEKTRLEGAYALSLDHSAEAQARLGEATLAVDKRIEEAQLARLQAVVENDIATHQANDILARDQEALTRATLQGAEAIERETNHVRQLEQAASHIHQIFVGLKQDFEHAFSSLASNLSSAIIGAKSFHDAWQHTIRGVAESILNTLIGVAFHALAQEIIHLLARIPLIAAIQHWADEQAVKSATESQAKIAAAHAAAGVAIVAGAKITAAAVEKIQTQLDLSQITGSAAVAGAEWAAANAWLGPLAAVEAGLEMFFAVLGTFSALAKGGSELASFDKGGWVPEDMVAQIHKGEYIIPADVAAAAVAAPGQPGPSGAAGPSGLPGRNDARALAGAVGALARPFRDLTAALKASVYRQSDLAPAREWINTPELARPGADSSLARTLPDNAGALPQLPRYESAASLPSPSVSHSSSMTQHSTIGDVHINVSGAQKPQETAREIARYIKSLSPKFSPAS